jgi:tetratricopeptide (TPR) repeat protein
MNRKQRRAAEKAGRPVVPPSPAAVAAAFADALRRHQAGRPAEARKLYREILAVAPRHADSLHLLGLLEHDEGRHEAAIDLIQRAIAINATPAVYHYNLAAVLEDLNRLDAAIACYRQALALKPDDMDTLNNLGRLLREQRQFDEAAVCFRRVLARDPADPAAHHALGNALQSLGKLDEAVVAYRKAIELRPDHAEAYADLGNTLRSQGRFEAASDAHRRALALGRDPGPSYYELSRCRKFTPADKDLISEIEAALDREAAASIYGRSMFYFALGKIYDDLGEYETAMRHYDEANRLEAGSEPFDLLDFARFVDWSIATFPVVTPAPTASDSELPLLIVGMPRSGTTLVEQILASHPEVAAGGELSFWSVALGKIRNRQVSHLDVVAEARAIRDYLALLGAVSPGAARVTDKMPFNFRLLGSIHQLFPRARIIHCRRNPVDNALSLYFTRFTRRHRFTYRREDIVAFYEQYRRLMAHWRAVLPADRFLEIDYERLVADQESVSRDLLAFCGLEWDDSCLNFHETDRPIATASAWQARQPLYRSSAERWRRYEPWLGVLRTLAP